MGLTRPRAHQLQDIDYKQAVRVITTTNVNLAGGAPNEVDGVSLSLGDRILVAGQSTGSQNGIYQVTTVGAGSSGTWARTATADETGEINAGMVVMVTEGTANADTQWKLTTDNPITVGTTALTFEQASAYALGTISANGTSIVADSVGDTVTFTPGDNIAITGNAASDTITIGVTGIALDSINSGTSNVSVVSSGGNVTVGIGGSEVTEFSSSGLVVTGNILPSANVTYNLGSDTARWNELFLAGSTLNLGALQLKDNGGSFEVFQSDGSTPAQVKGNIAAANVVGTVSSATTAATVTTATVTASGNISGGNLSVSALSTLSGNVEIQSQNQLRFYDSDSSHYVALRSSATLSANVTWTLPTSDGLADQVLTTNGGGVLSFQDGGGGGSSGSSYPNSTINTLPGSDGNYDLSKTPAQTTSETPFESGVTDAFGVNLGSVFSMMDPIGSIQTAAEGEGGTDLGVLT